jgi:hypothetical protein
MKRKVLFLFTMMAMMGQSLFAQAPDDWTQPVGMQYSMQVVAKLMTNTNPPTYSNEAVDMVGAFVGDPAVCRGVASPETDFRIYLTINSDIDFGEIITLEAYLAELNAYYTIKAYQNEADAVAGTDQLTVTFANASTSYGSYEDPIIFVAAPLQWTITPSVGVGDGTIDPEDPITVNDGENQSFTMRPAYGYQFTTVIIDDGSGPVDVYDENDLTADSLTYVFENVTSDWSIEANFEINQYDITFKSGANGQLTRLATVPLTGTEFAYSSVDHGTEMEEITAEPIDPLEFSFSSWSDGVTDNPRIITAEHDSTLTALFSPLGWTTTETYMLTMSIIGNIVIDGEVSVNPNDMVGAFIGDPAVCRGVASPNEDGLVFLSIGSDQASGEELTLKIWKNDESDACYASQNIIFVSNQQLGSFDTPYVFECQITSTTDVPVGYTWFSANIKTNTEPNAWNPNNYFADAWAPDPEINDRIIGQTNFAVYADVEGTNKWVGSLTSLNPHKMYRLYKQTVPTSITLTGSAVDPDTLIFLNAGYTWLGYLPRVDLPIADALVNLTGLVAGDRIISQNKFAIYNGTIWQGSLLRMYPGKGYIVQLINHTGTLTYPPHTYAKSAVVTSENEVSPAGFDVPTNMKNTMTLIGQLDKASFSENDVVYAFINGECRGMAAPSADGNIYLNIGDNGDDAQQVSFKVWVDAKGELANIDQTITFEPLKAVGDLNNPFTFKMSEAGTTDSWMVGAAYPNPFNEQTIIPLWLKESAQVTVNVYNNMGQLVKTVAQSAAKSGVSNIILQKENLNKGVYYYTVSINSSSATMLEKGKLIIQ